MVRFRLHAWSRRAANSSVIRQFKAKSPLWFKRIAHGVMAVVVLGSVLFPIINFDSAQAATANITPDGDVSTQWTVLGGSNDATCSGGTHCDYVDEGSTPVTTDYVSTGTNGSGGEIEEYTMGTVSSVDTATSITIYFYLQSVISSTADTVDINARINGTLQLASTVTMTGSWAWYSTTYTGSWSQSDIDSLQLQATRTVVGGGSPSSRDDDVRLAAAYATVTYTSSYSLGQSSYRWFENQDTTDTTFAHTLSTSGVFAEEAYDSVVDSSDNVIYIGRTNGSGASNYDVSITKYSNSGTLLWAKTWGGSNIDNAYSIYIDSNGDYMVAGQTLSFGSGYYQAFLIKFNPSGAEQWSTTIGDGITNNYYGYGVTQDASNNYVLTGWTGSEDGFITKLNSSGTEQWTKTWDANIGTTSWDRFYRAVVDGNGDYVVTGRSDGYIAGSVDAMIIVKYNSSGTLQWSKYWGGLGADTGFSIVLDGTDYVVVGQTGSYTVGGYDVMIVKFNSSGVEQWSKTWGGDNMDSAYDIIKAPGGGYIVVGETLSTGFTNGSWDNFLIKFDSSGIEQWTTTWGTTDWEKGHGVAVDSSGNYFTVGISYRSASSYDNYIAKFNSSGVMPSCSDCNIRTTSETDHNTVSETNMPTINVTSPAVTGTARAVTEATLSLIVTVACTGAIDVGAPLNSVAQNTATTALGEGVGFRLRFTMHATTAEASSGSFKLQYAQKSGTCDTSFTGETYSDVSTGTPISYYDNPIANDGAPIVANTNDPTHSSDTKIIQEYNESGNFDIANSIAIGEDGLWDIALTDNGAPATTSYCFRVVYSTDSLLNSYSVIPEITTMPVSLDQANYRWYKGQDTVPNNSFAQAWGGTVADEASSVVQTTDGGYATVGDTASYGAGNGDVYIAKYDNTGALSWSKTWGSVASDDVGWDIIQTTDGGYAITGYTDAYGGGGLDAFILKYDASGTLSWNRMWGGSGNEYAYELAQGTQGGIGIVGYTTSYGTGADDAFLAVFKQDGSLAYSRTWGSTGGEVGSAIVATADGGFAIAGDTSIGPGIYDAYIVRFNERGERMWDKTWGVSGTDAAYGLTQLTDGSFVMAGDNNGDGDAFLVKFADDGTVLWDKTWGGVGADSMFSGSVSPTADGGVLLSGQTDSFGAGLDDIYLAKFTSAGVLSWSKTWGGTGIDYPGGASQTSDGGYVVAGHTESYGAGSADMILLKYNEAAAIIGCSATMCQNPSATSATASGTVATANGTVTSPTATNSSPSANVSSPTATVTAIVGHLTFAQTWGSSGAGDDGRSIVAASDGGYAVTGDTLSFGGGSNDMYITKYKSDGSISWNKTWGSTGADYGRAITETTDGSFVVTGDTTSYGQGSQDMFVTKYSSTGTISWSRTWGDNGADYGRAVASTSDGGCVVTGETINYGAGGNDIFIAKYDSSGGLLWSRTWGGTGADYGNGIVQTKDGGYAVTGRSASYTSGGDDMVLLKYDSAGNLSWNTTWGGATSNEIGQSLIQSYDGGYAVTGQAASFGNGIQMFTAKFDSTGSLLWDKTWGGSGTDYGYGITEATDTGYVVAATENSYGAGGYDSVLVKYDYSGNLLWNRTFGDSYDDYGRFVDQTIDDGYVLVGSRSTSSTAGAIDMLIIKYDSSGNVTGCSSPTCQSPSATTGDPTAIINNPSAMSSSPVAIVNPYTITPATPSATQTFIYARGVWGESVAVPAVPLAAQDTASASLRHDDPLRLRFTVGALAGAKSAGTGGVNVKLQVAPRVGACDTSFTGESYTDLSGSTAFNYYDNTNLANGDRARVGPYDPTVGAGSLWYQNYQEASGYTNRFPIGVGDYGLWDVSLTTTDDAVYNSYCFRVINNDNSVLNTYTRVFEVSIPPAAKQQMRHGKFFDTTTETGQPFYW